MWDIWENRIIENFEQLQQTTLLFTHYPLSFTLYSLHPPEVLAAFRKVDNLLREDEALAEGMSGGGQHLCNSN